MKDTCEHFGVCGLDALDGHDDKCILHSEDVDKDGDSFDDALEEHREEHGADFRWMVFPGEANFGGEVFEEANFFNATFEEGNFEYTTFEEAYFSSATFEDQVLFERAFGPWEEIQFARASFWGCEFNGDVLFSGFVEQYRAFATGKVNFRDVTVGPNGSLQFRHADLSRCRFLRADLRDAEFTDVRWCEEVSGEEWFRRVGLQDEVVENRKQRSLRDVLRATAERMGSPEEPHWTLFEVAERDSEYSEEGRWSEVERLYRQLKRNYEARGDFPRAGDFHIGEKEARRKNPTTNGPLKFLLYAYRALSKVEQ